MSYEVHTCAVCCGTGRAGPTTDYAYPHRCDRCHGAGTIPVRIQFDADVSPQNEHNRRAAESHGLRYDPRDECYRDSDGCMIRDKFGQPY